MTLLNPSGRQGKIIHTQWGYSFQLTDDHLQLEQMNQMKFSYDELADRAYKKLKSLSLPSHAVESNITISRDLFPLLQENANNDHVLNQLWTQVNNVPSWVCWDQISRGQDCFYRYGGPALTGLAYQSLLGGMVNKTNHLD